VHLFYELHAKITYKLKRMKEDFSL